MAGRIEKLERLKEILGLFALPIPYESFKEDRSLNVEQCVTELLAKNLISKGDVSYLLHVEKMTDEQLWNFFLQKYYMEWVCKYRRGLRNYRTTMEHIWYSAAS
jgi:hypothetical protein